MSEKFLKELFSGLVVSSAVFMGIGYYRYSQELDTAKLQCKAQFNSASKYLNPDDTCACIVNAAAKYDSVLNYAPVIKKFAGTRSKSTEEATLSALQSCLPADMFEYIYRKPN